MWRLSARRGSPVLSLPPLLSLQNFLETNCTRAKSPTALLAQHDYLALFTNSCNIYVNLAVEEALLRALVLGPKQALLLCYVDTPCVVIGRNQNLLREVACRAACGANVKLARRYSGGGAVYHDTGNLCLSFLTPRKAYAPERTIQLVRHALCAHYAIDPARLTTSPRHDLFLDGRKITGSAMRVQKDIALHHCTLLVDSVRRNVGRYLHEEGAYVAFETSATSSVRATVTTLQECHLLKSSSSSLPFCTARAVDNIDISGLINSSSSSNDDNARQGRQNNNDPPLQGRTTRKRDTHRVDGCIEASKDNYTTHYHNNDEDIHTCVTHSCEPECGMTAAVQDLRQYMAHFFLQHADTILTHPTPWQLSLPESHNTHAYSLSEITATTCVRRGRDATSSEATQAAAQGIRQVCHSKHRNGGNRRSGDDAMTEAIARMLPAHKDITIRSSTASHNLRAAHDRVAREHAEEEHDEGNGLVSTLPVYVLDVVAPRTSHNNNNCLRRCSERHTQSTNSDERRHNRASGTRSKERPAQDKENAEDEEELTAKTTSCVVDCPLVWGEGRKPAAAESRTLGAEVRHLASVEWRWAMPPFTTVIRIDAQELQAALHERLSTSLSQSSSTSTLLLEQCRAMDRPTHALSGGRSGQDSEEDEEAIMIRRVLDALVSLVFPSHHQEEKKEDEVTGTMYNDDDNTAAMTTLARVATTSPAMTRTESATTDEADVYDDNNEKKKRETVTMTGRSTRKTTVKVATSKASHEAQKVSSSSSSSSSLHIRTTVEHRRITHLSLWRQQDGWNATVSALEGDRQRKRDPCSTTTQQEESNNNRKQNTCNNNNNNNNDNNNKNGRSNSDNGGVVEIVKGSEPEVHSAPETTAGVVASTQVSLPWLEAVLQALLLHTSCDAHHLHLSEDKLYDCTTAAMSSMAPSCDNDNHEEDRNASGSPTTATSSSSAGVHADVSHSTRHVRNNGSPVTMLPHSRGNNSDGSSETRTSSNSADNANNTNSRHSYHVKAEKEEGTTERMVVQGLQMEMSRAGVELPLDCTPESELYEAALLRFVHAIWRCWRHKNVFDFADTTN